MKCPVWLRKYVSAVEPWPFSWRPRVDRDLKTRPREADATERLYSAWWRCAFKAILRCRLLKVVFGSFRVMAGLDRAIHVFASCQAVGTHGSR